MFSVFPPTTSEVEIARDAIVGDAERFVTGEVIDGSCREIPLKASLSIFRHSRIISK
jgi:hypothetical protein